MSRGSLCVSLHLDPLTTFFNNLLREKEEPVFQNFKIAFQFLTAIPLFPARQFESKELARSMAAFPWVGAALGAMGVVFYLLVGQHLPPLLNGALLVALGALATGGFHLDGVADTVDGLAGGWTPEKSLEIMKDSRVGALGAVALCLVLVTKAIAFGSLEGGDLIAALIFVPAVGRSAAVYLAWKSPYARAEGGLGSPYTQHLRQSAVTTALVSSAGLCLLGGWRGFVAWAVVFGYVALLKGWMRRRLGGVTGDILGFSVETGEILALCVYLLRGSA